MCFWVRGPVGKLVDPDREWRLAALHFVLFVLGAMALTWIMVAADFEKLHAGLPNTVFPVPGIVTVVVTATPTPYEGLAEPLTGRP